MFFIKSNMNTYEQMTSSEANEILTSLYVDPCYEECNKTTIFELCIFGLGTKGDRARELSMLLFEDYLVWKQNNSDIDTPSIKFVGNAQQDIQSIYNCNKDFSNSEEILQIWLKNIEFFDDYYEKYNDKSYAFISCNII